MRFIELLKQIIVYWVYNLEYFSYILESRFKRSAEENDIKTINGKRIYSVRSEKLVYHVAIFLIEVIICYICAVSEQF